MASKDVRQTCQGSRPINCLDGTTARAVMPKAGPGVPIVGAEAEPFANIQTTVPITTLVNQVGSIALVAHKKIAGLPQVLNDNGRTEQIVQIVHDTVTESLSDLEHTGDVLNLEVNLVSLWVIIKIRNTPQVYPDNNDLGYAYADHYFQAAADINNHGPNYLLKEEILAEGYNDYKRAWMFLLRTDDPNRVKPFLKLFHTDAKYEGDVSPPTPDSLMWAEKGMKAGIDDVAEDVTKNPRLWRARQKQLMVLGNPRLK